MPYNWSYCSGNTRAISVYRRPLLTPDVPVASRQSELVQLQLRVINFCCPALGPQSGPVRFNVPPGIARICLIPIEEPDVHSGFQPSSDSLVPLAHSAAVQFSTAGILEYLDGLASSNRQLSSPEETATLGRILVGDKLDLEITAASLQPSDFIGTTLPTPPLPPLPTPMPSPPVAHSPSPPLITVLEADKPSPVPTPSPPPIPS
ncbi:hypothetical protein DFH08DRAFT_974493 [Mycena albidolilacea]|uniref:Uncharacterized protein n=1 Tax=Mycena albidolilacea TaxID=1033008 RepID=A0AAD6Z7A0_9AGAR|nr:hypothetical protein DFH08DRAFT_974493 [Mycena albidolilacea]